MNYPAVSVESAAKELNRLHSGIETKLRTAVQDAIRAGEILTQVKDRREHGAFLPWVEQNCDFSRQTADNYRRLYEHRDKMPRVGNLQDAYKKVRQIETETNQSEAKKARGRVLHYLKTGEKQDGWRRGTDDKLADEERARDSRINAKIAEMKAEGERLADERRESKERLDAFDVTTDDLLEAGKKISEQYEKRQDFKAKIRLSQDGEKDEFIDALLDYLKELESDSRRIEACQNIIKVCKNVAVDLQREPIPEGEMFARSQASW